MLELIFSPCNSIFVLFHRFGISTWHQFCKYDGDSLENISFDEETFAVLANVC